MFDIDFLKTVTPTISTHLLYTYVHGVFAPKVKTKVKELHEKHGRMHRLVDYERLGFSVMEPSLFGECCVWVALEELAVQRERKALFEELVAILRKDPPNFLFIYGRLDRAFTAHPDWPALFSASLTHVEEPPLCAATLKPILNHFHGDLSLTQVTNKQECVQELQAWIEQEDLDLRNFWTELDKVALLCVDDTTATFDVAGFRALVGLDALQSTHLRWHQLLAAFLKGETRGRWMVLQALDAALHKEGLDARALVALFHRVTRDLLAVNRLTNPLQEKPQYWRKARWSQLEPYARLNGRLLWLWQVRFAAAEPQLRRGGLLAWADFLETMPTERTFARSINPGSEARTFCARRS